MDLSMYRSITDLVSGPKAVDIRPSMPLKVFACY